MRVIHKAAIVGTAMVAVVGVGLNTAHADPYSSPATTSIVGVGSDTITPLFDGDVSVKQAGTLVTDYNTQSPVPSNLLWSWDATGTANITEKSGCASVARPDGSSAGITALEANVKNSAGQYCVDFARSSRAPQSGDPTTIAFASLAEDGISTTSPQGTSNPEPATLSVAQLTEIYSCDVPEANHGTGTNQWGDLNSALTGTAAQAPIVPVLPQSGSGTRSTFLLDLGSGGVPLNPGTCVVNGSNSAGPIEENTGTGNTNSSNGTVYGNDSQFDPSSGPAVDDIFPYSIGDWIAQGTSEGTYNGVAIGGHAKSPDFTRGVLGLYEVGGVAPTTTDNTSPYSGATVINRSFPLLRTLYDVVRNGGTASAPAFPTTPAYESALSTIFGPSGWACTNATAQADIASFGFSLLGRNCGSLQAG